MPPLTNMRFYGPTVTFVVLLAIFLYGACLLSKNGNTNDIEPLYTLFTCNILCHCNNVINSGRHSAADRKI